MDDNTGYRDLFFEETDEYLQKLNDCLLMLERNHEDKSIVDEIFRAAHTLKGMAATMGYNSMTELTHNMENVFELFRSGTKSINSDTISLIFKCLDMLSEIVEDLRSGNDENRDITMLVHELAGLSKNNLKSLDHNANKTDIKKAKYELSETDTMTIQNAQNGYNAFNISVNLIDECILKGPRAYLVVNRLEQQGEIIHTHPNIEQLEEGNFDKGFLLIYISKLDAKEVKEIVENISEIENVVIDEINKDRILDPEQKVETKVIHSTNTSHVNQSIRVDLNKLDNFMNLVSELVIYRTRLEDICNKVKNTEFIEQLENVGRISSQLHDLVLNIRMEPVSVVFNRFPRMVRDLSRDLGKEIELIIEGEETELDRTVVSELGEPLIHLIRNAADHGIESLSDRQAIGKSKKGLIKLSAYQEGNRVVITIRDDGKGIKAEVIPLIFNQGFSTAKKVTNVSGRGVGMDVVKQKISSLGGTIEVVSEINKGTSFIIKLPLTLSIIQALMVKVGRESFAIPLGIIEKVVKIDLGEILQSHKHEVYVYGGNPIPVVRLSEKLSITSNEVNKHIIIILLGSRYYGLLVDDLIGQQEIVIKKLSSVLSKMKEYLGASILGNGDITLILDAGNLCS